MTDTDLLPPHPDFEDIPVRRVKIDLTPDEPTAITPENLKSQLTNVGLTCALSSERMLKAYITEVSQRLPSDGQTQTYSILRPAEPGDDRVAGMVGDYTTSSDGNWAPNGTALSYAVEMETIIEKSNFDYLKAKYTGFPGAAGENTYQDRYSTVNSIKEMFAQVGSNASSILIDGLDQDSIKSILSNAIGPLTDSSAKDYNKTQSRVIFLVKGYDRDKQLADGIGVLEINWTLEIRDYKEKKKAQQYDTKLRVSQRAALFDSDVFLQYYKDVKDRKPEPSAVEDIPVRDPVVKIFDKRPPADRTTFDQSLPVVATDEGAYVLVLFSPDLQSIGSLDNTQSKAVSTYEKSVTTGFTFSSTQEISATATFEAGIIIAKGSLELSMSLSFTEEYTKQTTEAISFECAAGEIAYTYQGSLKAAKLKYDPTDQSFKYTPDEAKYLTEVFATTATPLGIASAVMVGGPSLARVDAA